jgi:3-methyladenine DNA glycosylase AlkC
MKEKETVRITDYFGLKLAKLLAEKILNVYPAFPAKQFLKFVKASYEPLMLTGRVRLIADALYKYLPAHYPDAVDMLKQIMGPVNPKETGMFTDYYWLMPVGKYIEIYGLDHLAESLDAIEELTQRNTGEYAIRPYITRYSKETIKRMSSWAKSESFHLRRLASEGLRPKLPWAPKLDIYINKPEPVFKLLEILKKDKISFVKRSVANNIADYLKVNETAALELIRSWKKTGNKDTEWILKHACRKYPKALL